MKRPFLVLAVLLCLGIGMGARDLSWYTLFISGLLGVIYFVFCPESRIALLLCIFVILCGFGMLRTRMMNDISEDLQALKRLKISGEVKDVIRLGNEIAWLIRSDSIQELGDDERTQHLEFLVKKKFSSDADIHRWDRVRTRIHIERWTKGERSSFAMWLQSRGVDAIASVERSSHIEKIDEGRFSLGRFLGWLKRFAQMNLDKGLDAESMSKKILPAMILGVRENIHLTVKSSFLYTNTVHILSISGLHVSLILGFWMLILGFFPIRRKVLMGCCIALIWFYAVFTGLESPIVRSAWMITVSLAGAIIGRKIDLANTLGFSAVVMLIGEPLLLFDPGFQLSFGSLLSLLFLSPIIEDKMEGMKYVSDDFVPLLASRRDRFFARTSRILVKILSGSLAVWLGILPLVAYHFGLVSPISVLANLAAIPITGFVMNLGFFSLMLGFMEPIAVSLNHLNDWLINFLVYILDLACKLPGAFYFVEKPTFLWMGIFYILMFLCLHRGSRPLKTLDQEMPRDFKPSRKSEFFSLSRIRHAVFIFLWVIWILHPRYVQARDGFSLKLFYNDDLRAYAFENEKKKYLWLESIKGESNRFSRDTLESILFKMKIKKIDEVLIPKPFSEEKGVMSVLASYPVHVFDQNFKFGEIQVELGLGSQLSRVYFQNMFVEWSSADEVLNSRPENLCHLMVMSEKNITGAQFKKRLDRNSPSMVILTRECSEDFIEVVALRNIRKWTWYPNEVVKIDVDKDAIQVGS